MKLFCYKNSNIIYNENRFSDLYLRMREMFVSNKIPAVEYIAEKKMKYFTDIDEKNIHLLWYEKKYNYKKLTTTDGKKLTVINPGEWNLDAGPDFINAIIKVDKKIFIGDVEIHRKYSDWKLHKHDSDIRYKNTILHVFIIPDRRQIKKHKNIFQVNLSKFININDIKIYSDITGYPYFSSAGTGQCSKVIKLFELSRFYNLLKYAGDGRIILKSKQFDDINSESLIEQKLYELLCESLGYINNRIPMTKMAKIFPIKLLYKIINKVKKRKRILVLESIYYGLSNLIPDISDFYDSETNRYLLSLKKTWGKYRNKFFNKMIDKNEWNFNKIRPFNHPIRRISALAYLINNFVEHKGLLENILKLIKELRSKYNKKEILTKDIQEFISIFVVPQQGYFARRTNFGKKEISCPKPLIGKTRALEMLVNIFIPFTLFYVQKTSDSTLETILHKLYMKIPLKEKNRYTKLFLHRLIGNIKNVSIKTEQIQQGLLQIFSDFCNLRLDKCNRCSFPVAYRFINDIC